MPPQLIDRKMMKFIQFINRLLKKRNKIADHSGNSPFTDLTPIDNADLDGCYSKALSFAFENQNIKNIALTGPYGSGKSSIIRTFELLAKLIM
jgi:DNA replication protein DnaC